jgi:hypothetical protein
MATAIAHHDQRAEVEAPATFDDLADAVDLHHSLFQLEIVGVDA